MHELMRDAAFASDIPEPWDGVVGGYLSAKGDPYHPWSEAGWAIWRRNRKLPIFVQSHPLTDGHPVNEAFAVLRCLYALGVPRGVRTLLDMETAVDAPYVLKYGDVMHWAGYRVWVYGSASTVFGNPPLNGYLVADYVTTGPFMYDHPDVRGTQYTDNPPARKYDSSTIKPWAYADRAHWWI